MGSLTPESKEDIQELQNHFSWKKIGIPKPFLNVNVLAAASHPAGARAVLQLISKFLEYQAECRLLTPAATKESERAATIFSQGFSFSQKPEIENRTLSEEMFSSDKTNVVIFSASGNGDEKLELSMIRQALEFKRKKFPILIIGVEDDASGLVGILSKLQLAGINILSSVDFLFLATRLSAPCYENMGFLDPKLITTGPTGFDFIHQENTADLGNKFRKRNAVSPNDIVIAYSAIRGTGLWSKIEVNATPKILSRIRELAIRNVNKKFIFVYCFHPDDQQPEMLGEMLKEFTGIPDNLRLITHQPPESRIDNRSSLAAADLAITTVSTANTGVALCGAKPENVRSQIGHMPLYYISAIAKDELRKTGTVLPTASQLQAAATAQTEQELLPSMEKALFDIDYRRKIFNTQCTTLRAAYRFKGVATATDRTMLHIRNLLKRL